MKQYRIGDFARHLGVTSDFLKHYEAAGLLKVQHRESGYRYYTFDQSAKVISCMRLRNYGVTVKEMGAMHTDDPDKVFGLLDKKSEELEATVSRLQAVIGEHKRMRRWYEAHKGTMIDWEIREMEPRYFLPHTDEQDFRKDDRIFELLKDWGMWMPVTKSALKVEISGSGTENTIHWGFAVRESLLKRYQIPVNDVLERIEFGKCFVCHFCGLPDAFSMRLLSEGAHPAWSQMKQLGFCPCGTAILEVEMRFSDEADTHNDGFGRILIPIKKEPTVFF